MSESLIDFHKLRAEIFESKIDRLIKDLEAIKTSYLELSKCASDQHKKLEAIGKIVEFEE